MPNITNGLQRVLDAAIVKSSAEALGGRVSLGTMTGGVTNGRADTYTLTRTMQIRPNAGLHLAGDSMRRTVLVWDGDNVDLPVFDFPSCRDTMVENLTVLIRGRCRSVFRYYFDPEARAGISTHNNRRRVTVIVEAGGYCENFAEFIPITGDMNAPNNEANIDEQCHVSNLNGNGWRYVGVQCKSNSLRDCRVNGNALTTYGVFADGGCFNWSGGGMAGLIGANFYINEPTDPIRIDNCDSDPSARFLVSKSRAGRTTDRQAIQIAGGRFMTVDNILAPDGHAIVMNTTGPLEVSGFQLGSGKQRVATILLDALAPVDSHVHDVQFDAHGSSDVKPIVGEPSRSACFGNTYRDANGAASQPTWDA